jgi:signal transduction histidine kinase/ActR/RegA family two-component response regulator
MSNEVIAGHVWDRRGVVGATASARDDTSELSTEQLARIAAKVEAHVGGVTVRKSIALNDVVEGRAMECVLLPLRGADGALNGALGTVLDLTERNRIEMALYERLAFEKLITELSTRFITLSSQEIDRGFNAALGSIGEFASADRAYVFLFSKDGTTMTNTHEWCAPGVEPQIHNLVDLPVQLFPWWTDHMRRRETIHIPRVIDLPEEAAAEKQILLEQAIQSVVVVPMTCGPAVVGFVGFDWVRTSKVWTTDDVALLRIVGEIFANAMNRSRAEEQRVLLEAQLVQTRSLENVAKLAGGVAHDFNNLLGVVLNYSSMLRKELTDARQLSYLDELYLSAKQAAQLTRQLLLAGRRGVVEPIALDLNEAIGSLTDLLRRTLGEHVTLKLELADELGIVRLGVPQIEQVILNLTLNARDAMPNGGRFTIKTATVELGPDDVARYVDVNPGRYTLLTMSDTGVGMPPEVAARAWDPFFTTKGELGTGLGLSTVHGIVKQAGGHLAIETAPGAGCAIRIYLPVVDRVQAQPKCAPAAPEAIPDGTGETILVVEDSLPVRKLVCGVLAAHGYCVFAAASPSEALEQMKEPGRCVDLLLADVMLPEMSGRHLADRLREAGKITRVLYMSGYENDVIAHQGILTEGVRLLQKPFLEEDLLRQVRISLCDTRR